MTASPQQARITPRGQIVVAGIAGLAWNLIFQDPGQQIVPFALESVVVASTVGCLNLLSQEYRGKYSGPEKAGHFGATLVGYTLGNALAQYFS